METIDINTPIWKLTVRELRDIIDRVTQENINSLVLPKQAENDEYIHGLKGVAKLLGCTISYVSRLKSKGLFEGAYVQRGRKIVFNKTKVLELFAEKYD